MKRAEFIKLIALGAAGAMLPGSFRRGGIGGPYKVVVLGAGIAGLAAARRLKDAGHEVVVVEARDRLGGRIHTDFSMGSPVELGAMFSPVGPDSPLSGLAAKNALAVKQVLGDQVTLYDRQGVLVSPEQWAIFTEQNEKLFKRLNKSLAKSTGDPSMRATWNTFLEGMELPDGYADYLSWRMATEETTRGVELDLISTRWSDPLQADQDRFIFAGGFSKVIDKLSQGLEIHLEQKARIIKESEGRVSVLSLDETFEGDFLVITLPLGVLRAGDIRIDPEPSHAKKTAIQKLGIGEANKIVLRYEKVSWPRDKPFIGLMGAEKGGFPQLINMAYFNGRPIIIATLGRARSLAATPVPDEVLVGEIQALLKKSIKNMPEPVETKVTHWASEKFTKGAYSYLPVGGDIEMRDFLARPEGRIFYAGEATMRQGAGTVKGAYLSGIRAAEWILDK